MYFNEENYNKGVKFEKYVINLFPESLYNIHNWNRDNSKILNRKVETDSDPDITVRQLSTNQLISVECKFASKPNERNKINWAKQYQIDRYLQYALVNNRPVFIVIGIGNPEYPEEMFCIPLNVASQYTYIPMFLLCNFERNPEEPFTWHNGILK